MHCASSMRITSILTSGSRRTSSVSWRTTQCLIYLGPAGISQEIPPKRSVAQSHSLETPNLPFSRPSDGPPLVPISPNTTPMAHRRPLLPPRLQRQPPLSSQCSRGGNSQHREWLLRLCRCLKLIHYDAHDGRVNRFYPREIHRASETR